jgi:hypothetical protein
MGGSGKAVSEKRNTDMMKRMNMMIFLAMIFLAVPAAQLNVASGGSC